MIGLSIVFFKVSHVDFSNLWCILPLKIVFSFALISSGSSLFAKVPLCGFPVYNGLKDYNGNKRNHSLLISVSLVVIGKP